MDQWQSKNPCADFDGTVCQALSDGDPHWLITAGTWQDPHRSLVKAAQVVRREAGHLIPALLQDRVQPALELPTHSFACGCRTNRRVSAPNTAAQFLLGMPLTWPKERYKPLRSELRARGHRWPAGKGWAFAKAQQNAKLNAVAGL